MPRYTFNFDLDTHIKGVVIDAPTLEEAKKYFRGMSLEYLLEEGFIDKYSMKNLDYTEEKLEDDLIQRLVPEEKELHHE